MTADLSTEIRIFIYDWLLAHGAPPTCAAIGEQFALFEEKAREFLAGMGIGKTVLTAPATGEIWMAGPFSAVETRYRVTGKRARWWANCAWDMFGVAMISGEDVRVDTDCADCGDPWIIEASPRSKPVEEGLVHFLLPAGLWYRDIGFT